MTTSILGLGTASPAFQMTQDEALQMFTDIVCEDPRQARLGRALFRKAAVQTRATVVPHRVAYDWCRPAAVVAPQAEGQVAPTSGSPQAPVEAGKSHGPTTRERMELYAQFAAGLACESSQKALDQAGIDAQQITHLVTVTCTGFDAPGVDIELIDRLGLPNTTQRMQIGFMGCHGAINGLRAARAVTESDPTACVLLCAVELCSLHYRFTWDSEGIIGNALFADGSAALVLGGSGAVPTSKSAPWQVLDTGSVVIADSKASMSWSIGDHGFDMRLGSDVGDKIEAQLADWLAAWLGKHNLGVSDIDYWGVHPGGPKIVAAVQSSLGLSEHALRTSRSVLARHGNMSSPTVLFILNEFQQSRTATTAQVSTPHPAGHCVLLGFGPGLVAEVALLSVPG